MKNTEFLFLLLGVSYATYKLTQQSKKGLIADFKYDVYLNMSFDVETDLSTFPNDDEKYFMGLTDKEVTELLCRDGKIPVWINIFVSEANPQFTTLKLECSGRYSNNRDDLYYKDKGTGPFGIKLAFDI